MAGRLAGRLPHLGTGPTATVWCPLCYCQVEDDMNKARSNDDLEWITPDVSTLKPKLA